MYCVLPQIEWFVSEEKHLLFSVRACVWNLCLPWAHKLWNLNEINVNVCLSGHYPLFHSVTLFVSVLGFIRRPVRSFARHVFGTEYRTRTSQKVRLKLQKRRKVFGYRHRLSLGWKAKKWWDILRTDRWCVHDLDVRSAKDGQWSADCCSPWASRAVNCSAASDKETSTSNFIDRHQKGSLDLIECWPLSLNVTLAEGCLAIYVVSAVKFDVCISVLLTNRLSGDKTWGIQDHQQTSVNMITW